MTIDMKFNPKTEQFEYVPEPKFRWKRLLKENIEYITTGAFAGWVLSNLL